MLSEGNHLFQASITILDNGVKLRIPNFWRDQETFFSFRDISGVELTTPSWYSVLTYSTINFNLRGSWVEAHGFTKSDALTIKKLIDNGRHSGGNSSINEFGEDTSKFSASKQRDWINYQHDRQMKLDREERIAKRNEQNKELIPKLKKVIIKSWIDILTYGNNNNFKKLSDMETPPYNKNAKKDINKYTVQLKEILYNIYEDLYEVEYKSIYDDMWIEIHEYIRDYQPTENQKKIHKLNSLLSEKNFKSTITIKKIEYPDEVELIEKILHKILDTAIEEMKKNIEDFNNSFSKKYIFKNNPYSNEVARLRAFISKSKEGIIKLKKYSSNEYKEIDYVISNIKSKYSELVDVWSYKMFTVQLTKRRNNVIFILVIIVYFIIAFILTYAN